MCTARSSKAQSVLLRSAARTLYGPTGARARAARRARGRGTRHAGRGGGRRGRTRSSGVRALVAQNGACTLLKGAAYAVPRAPADRAAFNVRCLCTTCSWARLPHVGGGVDLSGSPVCPPAEDTRVRTPVQHILAETAVPDIPAFVGCAVLLYMGRTVSISLPAPALLRLLTGRPGAYTHRPGCCAHICCDFCSRLPTHWRDAPSPVALPPSHTRCPLFHCMPCMMQPA